MGESAIDWTGASRRAQHAHELLETQEAGVAELPLRSDVRESWKRSLAYSSAIQVPSVLSDERLRLARERSELQRIWPVFEKLLVPAATDANLLVALADTGGTLLWVAGSHGALSQAEGVGFMAGADWAERTVGTSAPGMALATGAGSQVSGAEHLYERAHQYSCSAVPIRDPRTGQVIGAIDLTGGPDAIATHSLPLLQAAVMAAETQLLLPGVGVVADPDYLDLGRSDGAHLGSVPITLRHAEILTLLAQYREGLSTAQLVEELFERPDAAAEGTARAEIVRLRKVLAMVPGRTLTSRPYRLQWGLQTTIGRLWKALEEGDLDAALQIYSPGMLARSQAPGIMLLRYRAEAALREMVLDQGTAHQLLNLGRQLADSDLLRAALRELPADSPARSLIVAEVQGLDE
ncbi:helix-turn-helix domain-containing protein [Glutamicibacter sp.]|uniref:helix-turn-helix domain-containing protein n=1 Tax=Glutamicibacter sp. TaxID=1931995 RepID=UPI002B46A988|nr:GAF domain-containing protein [Glutamicibacter sp.]HJX77415.1 GAF domain-containing protein [Glutamicibacter sp.]